MAHPALRGDRGPGRADRPRRPAVRAAGPPRRSSRSPGSGALPGGFVRPDEDLRTARCARAGRGDRPGRLGAPRAAAPPTARPTATRAAGGHASPTSRWCPTCRCPAPAPTPPSAAGCRSRPGARPLAFDHDRILADGVERARAKLEYTALATAFCAAEFTVAELRRVYETVWGRALDPRNFHRKVTGTPGFVVQTGARTNRQGGSGRPTCSGGAPLSPCCRRSPGPVRVCDYGSEGERFASLSGRTALQDADQHR